MFGDVDWSDLEVASAFILGAVLGAVATIRLTRAVLALFDKHRDKPSGD